MAGNFQPLRHTIKWIGVVQYSWSHWDVSSIPLGGCDPSQLEMNHQSEVNGCISSTALISNAYQLMIILLYIASSWFVWVDLNWPWHFAGFVRVVSFSPRELLSNCWPNVGNINSDSVPSTLWTLWRHVSTVELSTFIMFNRTWLTTRCIDNILRSEMESIRWSINPIPNDVTSNVYIIISILGFAYPSPFPLVVWYWIPHIELKFLGRVVLSVNPLSALIAPLLLSFSLSIYLLLSFIFIFFLVWLQPFVSFGCWLFHFLFIFVLFSPGVYLRVVFQLHKIKHRVRCSWAANCPNYSATHV